MKEKKILSILLKYLAAAVFCAIFGAVYEAFSHEVYTPFMYLACLIPLLPGTMPYIVIHMAHLPLPSKLSQHLYAFGIATLTVGSIMQGVLIIYGTTNMLMPIYGAAGTAMLLSGLISYAAALIRRRQRKKEAVDQ